MKDLTAELHWDWEAGPVRIELELADLMADLDPRWEQWSGLEAVAS